MRKRQEYVGDIPEDIEKMEDFINSLIDEFEAAAMNIRDLLDIQDISDLGQVEEAYDSAKEIVEFLY